MARLLHKSYGKLVSQFASPGFEAESLERRGHVNILANPVPKIVLVSILVHQFLFYYEYSTTPTVSSILLTSYN